MEQTEQENLLPKGRAESSQGFMRYFRIDRLLMAISIVIAVAVLIASIVGSVSKTSSVTNNINEKYGTLLNPVPVPIPEGSKVTVPHAYGIPDTAITPVKDQMNMGTCWAFSIIGCLESSYRQNGIAKGYLDEDEFVSFSETAYAHSIIDYCTTYPEDHQCYGTGPKVGSVEDGNAEWLYYLGGKKEGDNDNLGVDKTQKVLPIKSCEYQNSEDDCADRHDKLKKSPISFTTKGIKTAYSVTAIRELLYEKKTALTWGSVIDEQTYMVPCDTFIIETEVEETGDDENTENNEDGENTDGINTDNTEMINKTNKKKTTKLVQDLSAMPEECKRCSFPVDPLYPFDETNPDYTKCFALYTLPSYDDEGLFSLHGKPFFSGGHAMLLVGYNDFFRIDTGRFGQLEEKILGGFIVKNSWSAQIGHSIKYWTQEISNMEEAQLCPDETAATKWLTADPNCMVNEGKSVEECSAGKYKRVRDKWITGATVLKCANLSADRKIYYGFGDCNPERNYVLASVPEIEYLQMGGATSNVWIETPVDSDGYFDAKLIEYNPLDLNEPAVLVTAKRTTWLGLSKVFEPLNPLEGNDEERCGYYFLPYQYFQEGKTSGPVFGHDTSVAVSWYDIEWNDSAYVKNKDQYPQFEYDDLIASSGKMKMYEFQGPLDYEAIKNSTA